jgi:hypothetical protein
MRHCLGLAAAMSGNGDAEFEQNNIRYAITDVNFALNCWGVRLGFRDAPRSGRLPASTQQLICGLSQVAVGGNGLEPMTFCIQDKWSRGDAWMGCQGKGNCGRPANFCVTVASQQQTSASRHKWAMVYDIQNCELRTSLQSVIAMPYASVRLSASPALSPSCLSGSACPSPGTSRGPSCASRALSF